VYVLSPYVVTVLVGWNVTSEERAKLIVALVAAVFSPALAFTHTDDGMRRWLYGMLMPTQSLLVGFGIATESQVAPVISAVVALLGGALASNNTPVSRPGEPISFGRKAKEQEPQQVSAPSESPVMQCCTGIGRG